MSVLLTDLYELTMLQSYFDEGMNDVAAFEFFVRKLPDQRNFLVATGLEQVLDYLRALAFGPEDLAWLEGTGRFSDRFLDSLADLRFTGDVDAMPEGTVFFADEPVVRITAPLREAQLVESRVMNLLHYQTMVASKAARMALAAPDRLLVDFGLRRAHGAEAGLLSARASYLAGFGGTATVEAGRRFGIPIYGTMAHSYVQVHAEEVEAFEHFARAHPDNATLLIDTYDTERAATRVVALARRLAAEGIAIRGVRIDSGDLAQHARRVRSTLDAAGFPSITIFASGNLDEYRLRDLVAQGAPIDGYGVGTRMNTSADAPYLDCAYKLEEYAGRPRRKRSEGKATWPGRKQVYRRLDPSGRLGGDTLALADESAPGAPLLEPVVRAGRLLSAAPALEAARTRARTELASLPESLRSLGPTEPYPVDVAPSLLELARRIDAEN
ncbi:MAG TPA: nicotinate phosphoribosyltransferase [Casimicrobiaceae bacterium]|nr:nicotinate phosphoribosyltransferase [Casimicrobiaceae bacterium]